MKSKDCNDASTENSSSSGTGPRLGKKKPERRSRPQASNQRRPPTPCITLQHQTSYLKLLGIIQQSQHPDSIQANLFHPPYFFEQK